MSSSAPSFGSALAPSASVRLLGVSPAIRDMLECAGFDSVADLLPKTAAQLLKHFSSEVVTQICAALDRHNLQLRSESLGAMQWN